MIILGGDIIATKYGTSYEPPIGLQEDNYYEMMDELMTYVKEKGLTTRQAQKLFNDCSDMILNLQINSSCIDDNKTTDMERLIDKIDELTRTISGIAFTSRSYH